MPSAGCFLFGQAALLAVGLPSAWAAGRFPPFRHGVTSTDPRQPPGHVETGFLSLRAGVAVRPDPLPWPGLLHYVGQFLGQFLVAGYSQVDWKRTPEVRQVLFRDIFVPGRPLHSSLSVCRVPDHPPSRECQPERLPCWSRTPFSQSWYYGTCPGSIWRCCTSAEEIG